MSRFAFGARGRRKAALDLGALSHQLRSSLSSTGPSSRFKIDREPSPVERRENAASSSLEIRSTWLERQTATHGTAEGAPAVRILRSEMTAEKDAPSDRTAPDPLSV